MRWGNPWLAFLVFPLNAVLFRLAGTSPATLAVGLVLFGAGAAYAFAYGQRRSVSMPSIRRRNQ
jgi:hypothetical protein